MKQATYLCSKSERSCNTVRLVFGLAIAVSVCGVVLYWPNDILEEHALVPSLANFYSSTTPLQYQYSIRHWGCQRNETPTIFVHIGKAGGGQIRARFAAAALDYDRDNYWKEEELDDHYYPLPGGEKAKFCNSKNRNHRYRDSEWTPKTYEGTLPCNATTPLGMALACPNAFNERKHACRGCNPRGDVCYTVYVGHNHMGSEFHWLPTMFLQKWWKATGKGLCSGSHSSSLATLDKGFEALLPNVGTPWCPWQKVHRPLWEVGIDMYHDVCGAPLAARMDEAFRQQYPTRDYSPWYASLPLHRVVLMRNPWTWIVSKFFWHKEYQKYVDSQGNKQKVKCDDLSRVNHPVSPRGGWADTHLVTYLAFLCGDDCDQRLEKGLMTIQEAEIQAASNLRNSFSVVGLLEETEAFLEMVSTRIAYVNMSLNPDVEGSRHTAKKTEESRRCDTIYQELEFRKQFRKAIPLMGTMERLYNLAVQVNKVQQQELNQCMGRTIFDT